MLHGNRTYLLQDANGQIIETHSISAGLDYPGVGPEHAWLKDTGRAEYVSITDDEALAAFHHVLPHRGHHPRARVGARARVRDEARADASARQDPARQSLRPRRQGHEHGRRARGSSSTAGRMRRVRRVDAPHESHRRDVRAATQRPAARCSFPTSPPAIRRSRRRAAIMRRAGRRGRRHHRARRAVLRSDGRRPGDPARVRARARAGRRPAPTCSTRRARSARATRRRRSC